jgi:hypothetical protein
MRIAVLMALTLLVGSGRQATAEPAATKGARSVVLAPNLSDREAVALLHRFMARSVPRSEDEEPRAVASADSAVVGRRPDGDVPQLAIRGIELGMSAGELRRLHPGLSQPERAMNAGMAPAGYVATSGPLSVKLTGDALSQRVYEVTVTQALPGGMTWREAAEQIVSQFGAPTCFNFGTGGDSATWRACRNTTAASEVLELRTFRPKLISLTLRDVGLQRAEVKRRAKRPVEGEERSGAPDGVEMLLQF